MKCEQHKFLTIFYSGSGLVQWCQTCGAVQIDKVSNFPAKEDTEPIIEEEGIMCRLIPTNQRV